MHPFARLFVPLLFCLTAPLAVAQTQLPPEVQSGLQWLSEQVDSEGRLNASSIRLSTPLQAEAETSETLAWFLHPHAGLATRLGAADHRHESEHLSRRILGLAANGRGTSDALDRLRALQNTDGGFGGSTAHRSTMTDTALALQALRAAGVVEGPDIARALDYLRARLVDRTHQDWQTTPLSAPYVHAHALLALQVYAARYPLSDSIAAQRQFLIDQQGQGQYAQTLLDAVSVIALQRSGTDTAGLDSLKAAIRSTQSSTGHWENDAFLTAIALRALGAGVIGAPPAGATLRVRLRDGATLADLHSVTMRIGEQPNLTASSGSDGRIELTSVAAGTVTLRFERSGYTPLDVAPFALVAGETRDLGTLDLYRAQDQAILFGRVTNALTELPIANAQVTVSGDLAGSVLTGPDGRFEMSFVASGAVTLTASAPGFATVSGSGALALGQATLFSPALVPTGNTVPPISVVLAKVINARDSSPIGGASLAIGADHATSAADGRVRLEGLSPGGHQGQVTKNGFITRPLRLILAPGANDLGPIRLQPEQLLTTSELFGRVVDQETGVALPGATVAIVGTSHRILTDASGRFRIAGIEAVPFRAMATAPGYLSQDVSVDTEAHAVFEVTFTLQRSVQSDLMVALDGLTMSAPEYPPFGELGVLGTVRNLSTANPVQLVFDAIVSDAAGTVIREVPHIQTTLVTPFEDTIITLASGQSQAITIIWVNGSEPAGDYQVRFRGLTPDGRVAVEGTTQYRIIGERILGGGLTLSPPILQAGTGQSVAIGAMLTNMGNQPIPAGDVRLQIKLVAEDDRPPLPPKPTIGPDLAIGSPLQAPKGMARDAAGNLYTVNSGNGQLIRVDPQGTSQVLRTLPTLAPTGASLGVFTAITLLGTDRLRVVHRSGWAYDVLLDGAATVTAFQSPPATVSGNVTTAITEVDAYAIDPVGGLEYFGGRHATRARVLTRALAGPDGRPANILIDAGMTDVRKAVLGADGVIHALTVSTLFRVDTRVGVIEPVLTGLSAASAIAQDAGGNLYVYTAGDNRIVKRTPSGTTSVFASGIAADLADMIFGNDQALYGAADDGSIRRYAANGAESIVVRSLVNSVAQLSFDDSGGLFAADATILRHRSNTGVVTDINKGGFAIQDMVATADPLKAFVAPTNGGVIAATPGGFSFHVPSSAGTFRAIDRQGNDLYLLGSVGQRSALLRSTSGAAPVLLHTAPFTSTIRGLYALPDGDVVVINTDSVIRLGPAAEVRYSTTIGTPSAHALSRNGQTLWLNSGEGLLQINVVTGQKVRLRNALTSFTNSGDEDASGRLIFTDTATRRVVAYSSVTDTVVDVATAPTGLIPTSVLLAGNGDAIVRFSDGSLRRVTGSVWTTLLTGSPSLVRAADGRVGYVTGTRYFEVPTLPGTARLVSTQIQTPEIPLWFDDNRFGDFSAEASLMRFHDAVGTLIGRIAGYHTGTDLAATTSGDLIVLHGNGHATRWNTGGTVRLVTNTNLRRLSADGNEVWVSSTGGLFRIESTGTLTPVLSVPEWTTTAYRVFARKGTLTTLAHGSTQELRIQEGSTLRFQAQPIQTPQALEQRPDGRFVVATATRIVDVDPSDYQSRELSTIADAVDLAFNADGALLAARRDMGLWQIDADGSALSIAGIRSEISTRLVSVLPTTDAEVQFALSDAGGVYRRDRDVLDQIIAGIRRVDALMVWRPGELILASNVGDVVSIESGIVFRHANGVLTRIGRAPDPIFGLCALDGDTLALSGATNLSVLEPPNTLSFVPYPNSRSHAGIACTNDGRMFLADTTRNAISTVTAGPQSQGLVVGDVVREQVVSMPRLDVDAQSPLTFQSWMPTEGGDYEITLTPLDADVSGGLISGIHVGPHADARLTVDPAAVSGQTADVRVIAEIAGADFTHLSRVNRGLLQNLGDAMVSSTLGIDPFNHLWYRAGFLYRRDLAGTQTTQVTDFQPVSFSGEIPIDQEGRAYVPVSQGANQAIRRVSADGSWVQVGVLPGHNAVSLTINHRDEVFVLTSNNRVLRVEPTGAVSEYAALPNDKSPFVITRDAVGNLYVQQTDGAFNDRIVRIDTNGQLTTMDLRGAKFEHEGGANIAGDCADSLYMTPIVMPGTSQTSEEHTIVQLLPATGQIGEVVNGKSINTDLTDIDFLFYDRFGSRFVMITHASGYKLYSMPVACGAIDTDYHLVMPPGQPVLQTEPPPTSVFTRDDSSIEYVWNLRDVNRQGLRIVTTTRLSGLVRGERRPAAQEAFLSLRNTFQPEPFRMQLAVPTVQVVDHIGIHITLDRASYPPHTAVDSLVRIANPDAIAKSGQLRIEVLSASGAVVATLVDRPQTLAPQEAIDLFPPFNTGGIVPGSYRLSARLLDDLGAVVAQSEEPFEVTAGDGSGPALIGTLTLDRDTYRTGDTATATSLVRNGSPNQPWSNLSLRLALTNAQAEIVRDIRVDVPFLAGGAEHRTVSPIPLQGLGAGTYTLDQTVRDDNGSLLDQRQVTLVLEDAAGLDALRGTLDATPPIVRRDETVSIARTIQNRSGVALTGLPVQVDLLADAGTTVLRTWTAELDLAPGETDAATITTPATDLAIGDYVVALQVTVNGQTRVIAQDSLRVRDVRLSGEIAATVHPVRQGQLSGFRADLTNSGNMDADDVTLLVDLHRVPGNEIVRSFSRTVSLDAGSVDAWNESLATAALAFGNYRFVLRARYGNAELLIDETDLLVQAVQLSGAVDADPEPVTAGQPLLATGSLANTGNIDSGALTLRLSVLRAETEVVQTVIEETRSIAAGNQITVQHVVDTTAYAAGDYLLRFEYIDGGRTQIIGDDPFVVAGAATTDVRVALSVPRDARVLVLMSCSTQQAAASGHSGSGAQANCAQARRTFLSSYLAARGIEHEIVLEPDAFMNAMRCGRYNVLWISGGSANLSVDAALELRESIYRGDGLILDGEHDQRNSQLDEMQGANFRGHLPTNNQSIAGAGFIFPQVARPTYGRGLRLELTNGRTEATFVTSQTPAIISAQYGQGRALTYAFDLVAVLERDGNDPASERLAMHGVLHVVPLDHPAHYPVGARVPVTTEVSNFGLTMPLALTTSVQAPGLIVDSAPAVTSGDPQYALWRFDLAAGASRTFDVSVLTGSANTTTVRSEVREGQGQNPPVLDEATLSLVRRDATAMANALTQSLQATPLSGGERAARDRALTAIAAARSADGSGNRAVAIDKWLDAIDEVRRIQSVSHAAWRRDLALLLAASQHIGCATAERLCGTSPTTPTSITDEAFLSRGVLLNARIGSVPDWEWAMGPNGAGVPALTVNQDWASRQPIRFRWQDNTNGDATLTLLRGSTLLATRTFSAATLGTLPRGNALRMRVAAHPDVGNSSIKASSLRIQNQNQTTELNASASSPAQAQAWFAPNLLQGANIEGDITMDLKGNRTPTGSQLEWILESGQLRCHGATP